MLGVIIGVCNIILIVSILRSGGALILKQFKELGANTIWILPADIGESSSVYLTLEDIKQMRKIPQIVKIIPSQSLTIEKKIKEKIEKITIIGASSELESIEQVELIDGRNFKPSDFLLYQKVCVMEENVCSMLFPYQDPIGKNFEIEGIIFKVIGKVKKKELSFGGMSVGDNAIYIPCSTGEKVLGLDKIHWVQIYAKEAGQITPLINRIEEFLRTSHGGRDIFKVESMEELIKGIEVATNVIAIIIGIIAGISLLVGGIGIMNMMLTQIRERTREIGIRRAIGAKKEDILLQFLIESCILTIIGGIVGVVIGLLGANLIAIIGKFPFILSWQSIILGLGVSMIVGIFFGAYPARLAASQDPIESLRYE